MSEDGERWLQIDAHSGVSESSNPGMISEPKLGILALNYLALFAVVGLNLGIDFRGGILIEAALTGRPTLGIDFDPVMVDGSQQNIDWAKVDAEVKRGDATRFELPKDTAAVVVDPPYGRNSPSDEKLIGDMLANIRSQNNECKLVVILPVEAGGDDLDEEITTDIELPGYEIKTAFGIPVHKSLGRVMIIAEASTQD